MGPSEEDTKDEIDSEIEDLGWKVIDVETPDLVDGVWWADVTIAKAK